MKRRLLLFLPLRQALYPLTTVILLSVVGVGGFRCDSAGQKSACSVGDLGLITGLGRSAGEGKGYPLQYCVLENSMDCPWGRKEWDMTEQLSLSFFWCTGGGGLFVKWEVSDDLTLTFSQGSTWQS